MKAIPLFQVLSMIQDTDKAEPLTNTLIEEQVAMGLYALEQNLLDDFARAKGYFSAEARRDWREGYDACQVTRCIRQCIQSNVGQWV